MRYCLFSDVKHTPLIRLNALSTISNSIELQGRKQKQFYTGTS